MCVHECVCMYACAKSACMHAFVRARTCVCVCVCVFARMCMLRTASMDMILHFINTLLLLLDIQRGTQTLQ